MLGRKETFELRIGKMTCTNCQRHVQDALESVPGVASASVDLATGTAVVKAQRGTGVPTLTAAVAAAGYTAQEA